MAEVLLDSLKQGGDLLPVAQFGANRDTPAAADRYLLGSALDCARSFIGGSEHSARSPCGYVDRGAAVAEAERNAAAGPPAAAGNNGDLSFERLHIGLV